MKKIFLGILLSLFLCNFAYALPFSVDLDKDGTIDTIGENYVDALTYATVGAVDLTVTSVGVGTASGTFLETSLIKVNPANWKGGGITSPEMTIVMEGSGNFTADYNNTTDAIGDQAFNFSSGNISIYIDDWDTNGTTYYGQPGKTTDGSLYGANDGALVAQFNLNYGHGTLQSTPGQSDNVDIWSLSTSVLNSGYLFFEGMKDFADVSNPLTGIFVQMYTNDTNHLLLDTNIIGNMEAEFTENSVMQGSKTKRIYVRSEGSAKFSVVPEPATMILLGLGLLSLAGISRKKFV